MQLRYFSVSWKNMRYLWFGIYRSFGISGLPSTPSASIRGPQRPEQFHTHFFGALVPRLTSEVRRGTCLDSSRWKIPNKLELNEYKISEILSL